MSKSNRSRPANPWWQRWLRRWRTWRGAGLAKTHQVDLIEIDGQRLKRVIFDSAETALAVSKALRQTADTGLFPALVFHHEFEVRVEFIPGPLARPGRDELRLAAFFIELYRLPNNTVSLADSGLMPRLESDLDFLLEHSLVEQDLSRRLLEMAGRLAPPSILLGHDYIDPVAKNFVIVDGRAIAIDIEALLADQPLGTGVAKARLRWPGLDIDQMMSRPGSAGGPDLIGQYAFIELCFLASYFRQKIIQRKPRHLQPEALRAWLRQA